ncbi:MAG: hypothetical protein HY909_00155 [Deltaproteobacteria bacterium]|nr:hypothetical protein [Deltaproteobacteria bacterium]
MESKYRYNKVAGALQEGVSQAPAPMAASTSVTRSFAGAPPVMAQTRMTNIAQGEGLDREEGGHNARARQQVQALEALEEHGVPVPARARRVAFGRHELAGEAPGGSLDGTPRFGRRGMFWYTVDEGQHVLVVGRDGAMEEVVGPRRIWRWGKQFRAMAHHVAHPGEFLIVRYRDGGQEHLAGPAHVWVDPRKHLGVTKEEALQIASKESVVVYARDPKATGAAGAVTRRVVDGPAVFVPEPGEWLHTFSWHGSRGGSEGNKKVANALVFQKLWRLPDQMYHDVADVRTRDDAVLTIRLMMFFELLDVEMLLATSHDPIGDFVNATTSDVVDFMGRHDFEGFKRDTERLNDLAAYPQLAERARQCGYRINKVVYRGYGLPPSLQSMHDQAIESRTRLALERATQQQAQELEDFTLERQLARGERMRGDRAAEQTQELQLARQRQESELEALRARQEVVRAQARLDEDQTQQLARLRDTDRRAHLEALRALGVDLTALLTQHRADQVIELRGAAPDTHVHLTPAGE